MKIKLPSQFPFTKASFFIFLLSLTSLSQAQENMAVGLRLGDPSGLTLKKYLGDNAWQLNVGRSRWFQGDVWYGDRFGDWYGDNRLNFSRYEYLGYKRSFPLAVQLHYLFNNEITEWDLDGEGRLFWYYGFGAQLNYQSYVYDYRYKVAGDPRWFYDDSGRVYDIDLGLDVVIGAEFIFSEIPLSVFVEMNLFLEAIDDPFFIRGQGGIGGRYHF
jgi:hypothetical protein